MSEDNSLYFAHPITQEEVFVIVDVCHAVKLVWNTPTQKQRLIDDDNRIINCKYF